MARAGVELITAFFGDGLPREMPIQADGGVLMFTVLVSLATGVAAGDEGHTWREPDVVVTCVRPEGPYVRSPRVIVEVLSPSTEKEDRTTKLDFYETLPSLDAVLFLWQDDRRVRLRVREGNGWVDLDLIGSGTVRIDALGVDLTLDEIYADHWEPAA